jgi:hypothetical protein
MKTVRSIKTISGRSEMFSERSKMFSEHSKMFSDRSNRLPNLWGLQSKRYCPCWIINLNKNLYLCIADFKFI